MRKTQVPAIFGLAVVFGVSSQASAEWTFPGWQGYLRSTCLDPGSSGCYGDPSSTRVIPEGNPPPIVYGNGTGSYLVEFPGLAFDGIDGGNVQVNAVGGSAERCKVAAWDRSADNVEVIVDCYGADGTPANSLFAVSYIRRGFNDIDYGPESAYVWDYDPSSPSFDATVAPWTFNSTLAPVVIFHPPGTGTYDVIFGGQDASTNYVIPNNGDCSDDNAGTIEVTAYGNDNTYCKAAQWPMNRRSGRLLQDYTEIAVSCFDGNTGDPSESQFTLRYSTLSPSATQSAGFTYGDQPTADSYMPSTTFSRQILFTQEGEHFPHCILDDPVSITRLGTGIYNVYFSWIDGADWTNANVTGVGSGSDTCKTNDWWRVHHCVQQSCWDGGMVQVACYSAAGSSVDSRFVVSIGNQFGYF